MKPFRQLSLAARLAFFFGVVTAAVFSIAGAHLYQYSSALLQQRDDAALVDAVQLLQHQVEEAGTLDAVRNNPHPMIDVALAQRGLLFAIRTADGALVTASEALAEALPADPGDNGSSRKIVNWRDHAGTEARYVSVPVRVADTPAPLNLIVGHQHPGRVSILKAYGQDLIVTALLGAAATALMGYVIARRGFRPIKRIAQAAGDITASHLNERLRVEDAPSELEAMVVAFNRMLDRLEDSFRRLTQFSSDLAHDLRTPLSNLMGETQVALGRSRTIAEYQALLGSNIEELERLTRMIEDMLFLARADNPATVIKIEHVDLRVELDKVADFYQPLAQERELSIECTGNAIVRGDALLLQRAIHNLLSNAVRYSQAGGVIAANIRHSEDRRWIEISVTNPGPGIPEEHLQRVFDRLYRADSARQKSDEGTGLGLAIVRSIAQLHGGEVEAISGVDDTTTFILRLPIRREIAGD